jgi:phospholipid/cholesterol/gamma-HCH transport system substrate-binding protein
MAASREVRVGLFLLVAFLIVIALFELLGRETLFGRSVEYRTSFKSIPTLKVGDPVRLAGVDVGTVKDIRLIGARVEVLLRLKAGTPVKTDSVATIKLTSLLGTNFVDLTFGSPAAEIAPPGSLLASTEPPDLNTLVARLNDAAGDIQALTRQLNEGLGKSMEPIQATFQTLDKIAKKIEKGEGTLGRLVTDDSLFTEIRGLTGSLNQVSQQMAKGQGTLGRLLQDDSLYTEIRGLTGNLSQVSQQLAKGQGTLGRLLQDDSLYKEMRGLTASLALVSQQLARGQGTLGKLIADEGLYKDLRSLSADLKSTTGTLASVMKDVEAGKGSLGKLVRDESLYNEALRTLTEARTALGGVKDAVGSFKGVSAQLSEGKGTLGKLMTDEALYNDMRGAVASLNAIMKKVEKGEGTLGKLVNDESLYFTTKDSLKKVGKGADTLREQGPLSLIGIAIQGFGLF